MRGDGLLPVYEVSIGGKYCRYPRSWTYKDGVQRCALSSQSGLDRTRPGVEHSVGISGINAGGDGSVGSVSSGDRALDSETDTRAVAGPP